MLSEYKQKKHSNTPVHSSISISVLFSIPVPWPLHLDLFCCLWSHGDGPQPANSNHATFYIILHAAIKLGNIA